MRFSRFVIGLFALLPLSAADTKDKQRADTPVIGYAFAEASRELRAILGVPGSSRWSDALPLPEGVTHLRVANGHRWALAISANETAVLFLDSLNDTLNDTLKSSRLDTAGSMDDAIFSPNGGAVAIRRGAMVTVFTGMPDTPTKSGEFESNDLAGTALSDTGEAVAIREGRIVKAATGELVQACPGDCRVAYFPNSSDLAIFESGRLTELRGGESRVIAEGLQITEIQQLGAGSSRIGLASKEKLLVVERASGAIAAEENLSGTDRMEAMRLPGTWLLSAAEESAAWLYSNEGVRFVPAAARSKEQ